MGEPNEELMNTLKVYSATRFGKTRTEVEREIESRWSAAEKAKGGEIGTTEDIKPISTNQPQPAPQPAQAQPTTKPLMDTSSTPNTPSAGSQTPNTGFLDGWLSQQN